MKISAPVALEIGRTRMRQCKMQAINQEVALKSE